MTIVLKNNFDLVDNTETHSCNHCHLASWLLALVSSHQILPCIMSVVNRSTMQMTLTRQQMTLILPQIQPCHHLASTCACGLASPLPNWHFLCVFSFQLTLSVDLTRILPISPRPRVRTCSYNQSMCTYTNANFGFSLSHTPKFLNTVLT